MRSQCRQVSPLPVSIHGLPKLGRGLKLAVVVGTTAPAVDLRIVHPAAPPARTWLIAHLTPTRERARPARLHPAAARPLVNGRSPSLPLNGQAAMIDARGLPGVLQSAIGVALPSLTQPAGRALLGQPDDALTGLRIAVANNQMTMRIVGVLPLVMDRRVPRGAPLGDRFGIAPHKGGALFGGQLLRQGKHDLVGHAGILPV